MLTTITRRYHFESAHWLPHVPDWHKCRRMHGHNYEMEIVIEGVPKPDGFILDFFDVDKEVLPLLQAVDHRCLNEISGLENPTAELIAAWFLEQLQTMYPPATKVRIYETKDCWAEVCR
jgi:6-pyruvoyltetrahydropterin/6-carboxytetrahydropterin synthase